MRRMIIGFTLAAGICAAAPSALAQLPASLEQQPPCSSSNPCATPFEENGKWGVRNAKGEVTVPAQYSHAQLATERHPKSGAHGLIITRQDLGGIYKRLGLVDRNGVEVTPPKYWEIWEEKGVFTGGFDGKLCGFNAQGVEFIACGATTVARRDEWIEVTHNKVTTFLDYAGNEIAAPSREQQLAAAPPRPPAPPAALPKLPEASSRVRDLANSRNWDAALRASLTGTPHDRAYALLRFYDFGSTSDANYAATLQVLETNMGIFHDALQGTDDYRERGRLRRMQDEMTTYIRDKAAGPGEVQNSGRMVPGARTVGECHARGGSVGVMGYCTQ